MEMLSLADKSRSVQVSDGDNLSLAGVFFDILQSACSE